jgi:hypothetical protein
LCGIGGVPDIYNMAGIQIPAENIMPELPKTLTINPTVEAIYRMYEDTADDWRRWHLGASQIGGDCDRALWYTFRWASQPKIHGRIYRLFDSGYRQEGRLLSDLHKIGVEIWNKHPNTGRQFHFEEFGGHYAGNLDAVGRGFLEAPKTPHVVECKTMSAKNFAAFKNKGVKVSNPVYYAQCQVYMKWTKLDRAYLIAVCKDTDEIHGERIYFNGLEANQLKERAKRIIFRDTPPPRIYDDPNGFQCRWCDHKEICHLKGLPIVGCRTCARSTPEEDGNWYCSSKCQEKGPVLVDMEKQKAGCGCHIFIPNLVPLEQTDADPEKGTISYGQIVNGPGAIASKDLQEILDKMASGEIEI